jgi:hypothetical protein
VRSDSTVAQLHEALQVWVFLKDGSGTYVGGTGRISAPLARIRTDDGSADLPCGTRRSACRLEARRGLVSETRRAQRS